MNAINNKPFNILKNWEYNLNEGNLSELLKLYNKCFELLTTSSSEIITDHEQLEEYFLKIIKIQKGKVKFQPKSISEQKVCENTYILCGKYFFHLIEGERLQARFSFLINLLSENPIIHHHSSQSIRN